MALQQISYNTMVFADVLDLTDFYKTKLPEMNKVRSIFDSLKLLLSIPSNRIILSVAEGERIYKYTLLTPTVDKQLLGWFVYLPELKRLDLYVPDTPQLPIAQWKNRKVVFENYPDLYSRVGFEKLFSKIVNLV